MPETLNAGGVEQYLTDGKKRAVVQLGDRSLRAHIEGADAIDLVAEEVETQRIGGAGREEIDDAAAHRVVAAVGHRFHPAMARCASRATSSSRSSRSPRRTVRVCAMSSAAAGIFCSAAETVVSNKRGFAAASIANRLSASMRRPPPEGSARRDHGQAVPGGQLDPFQVRGKEVELLGELGHAHVVHADHDQRRGRLGREVRENPGVVSSRRARDGDAAALGEDILCEKQGVSRLA